MLQMPEKYVFLIMYYKCVYMVYVKLGKDPNEEIEFGCVVGRKKARECETNIEKKPI